MNEYLKIREKKIINNGREGGTKRERMKERKTTDEWREINLENREREREREKKRKKEREREKKERKKEREREREMKKNNKKRASFTKKVVCVAIRKFKKIR